nr:hypothetical protein [Tanacetum cinerariifolium]
MVDFLSGQAVTDAAQRKCDKYVDRCAAFGYGFLLFSFSSLGELETYTVILLKQIHNFSITQDIGARAAIQIFNRISFTIAKRVGAQIVDIYGKHVVSRAGIIGIKHHHIIVRDTLVGILLCPIPLLTYVIVLGFNWLADFVPGRVVIDVAQCKCGKYMDKYVAIGYEFISFSFSSMGKLEVDAVTLLKGSISFPWLRILGHDDIPTTNTYSRVDVAVLNTRWNPIQKQPETLLCLVGLSQRCFLADDVYLTLFHDEDRDMDLLNLISSPNPSKVKTGLHPRDAHEESLLTATASWVIDMEDPDAAT